jgi:hypothetical protein
MALSPKRRKKILLTLGVTAWLFLLGVISYCLCLPDLDAVSDQLRAIREDPNLTTQQKIEKSREIFSTLTPGQARQVSQNDFKKWAHERNAEMRKFLQMSLEEQGAYVKKKEEERKQLRQQGGLWAGGGPKGGGGGAGMAGGGGMVKSVGGALFFGAGGGPGGKPSNPSQLMKTMLDDFSPETRAGMSYQKGLSEK